MAKIKTIFYCQECGYQSPKWLGKCPDCGAWNTLVEERVEPTVDSRWLASGEVDRALWAPKPISEIEPSAEIRAKTGSAEFDRVLGGGVVAGSVILIGGDPGIGKSTLLLHALNQLGAGRGKVLYVSGEESPAQLKLRADRLQIASNHLYILAETSFEEILQHAKTVHPVAIVVDSIQTIYTRQLTSAPGSVTQIREVASQLMVYAKRSGVAVLIVGHVTKEGAIAGPRVLEHIVDTVLYFEGDKGHPYRILRAVKNRFGSTNELGVFEMKGAGLIDVENPSGLFLAERPRDASGSVVVAAQEGTRPILVELQALVSPSYLGTARRMALGVDPNRTSLLLAVLEKRAGLHLAGQDVFINVVSGIRIDEPAMDLGIAAAVASSFRERPVDPGTVIFGEIGLAGEIRGIQQAALRIREAEKLGFKRCILPKRNEEALREEGEVGQTLEVVGVSHVAEALELIG
ncbi:MAG: DNA repair protein RadA [Nitrospirae bacterium]|nr:DNA repair protein RadA [Candidatus Manganitrophaceae bacterium]